MRAHEVHAILREVLGPEMKRLGFRRFGSNASWYREEDHQRFLLVCTYISWLGFDEERGNFFVLEIAYASEPKIRAVEPGVVRRLGELLTPSQVAELTEVRNRAHAEVPALDARGGLSYYYPPACPGICSSSRPIDGEYIGQSTEVTPCPLRPTRVSPAHPCRSLRWGF